MKKQNKIVNLHKIDAEKILYWSSYIKDESDKENSKRPTITYIMKRYLFTSVGSFIFGSHIIYYHEYEMNYTLRGRHEQVEYLVHSKMHIH